MARTVHRRVAILDEPAVPLLIQVTVADGSLLTVPVSPRRALQLAHRLLEGAMARLRPESQRP